MRRFFFVLIGTLLIAQPLETSAQSPPQKNSLYYQILTHTRNELTIDTAEESVVEFVKNIFQGKGVTLNKEKINAALVENKNVLCEPESGTPKTRTDCELLFHQIRAVATAEAQVRMLGRDLQAITAGYEFPIEGEVGRFLDLPLQYNSIISIWRTGTGSIGATATGSVRTVVLDKDSVSGPLETLGARLRFLSDEERTAAVWRYRHGYQFIRGDHGPPIWPLPPVVPFHKESDPKDPQNGLDTERQHLFRRVEDIEKALEDIWNLEAIQKIKDDPNAIDPPLKKGEIVLFVFPPKIVERTLPQNILVWARLEYADRTYAKDRKAPYTWGDIGLQWHIPIDPVAPSLIGFSSQKPILGGQYPPNPIDNKTGKPLDGLGLCVHPTGRQGYLCRARTPLGEEVCQEEIEPEPDTIILARCSEKPPSTDLKKTEEQLVCPGISWRDEKESAQGNKDKKPKTVCSIRNPSSESYRDPNFHIQDHTFYRNTIGNTACYIGQCVEESMRTHRLVSGRNTFVTQDAAYPWDPRMKSTTGGSLLTSPPLTVGPIPQYHPERILNAFDESLCQSVGLPPRTPPALCMFNELRSLAFPTDFLSTAFRLLIQTGEQFEPFFGLRNLAASIGTRISTELYAQYLQTTTKSLAELIRSANIILKEIQKTSFPDEMCPTNFDLSQPQQ